MPADYSGKNLRGWSFKDKDENLEGANFSYADIRGTNFTGANLRGANFTGAKAGLELRWMIIFIIASLIVSILSAFITAFATAFTANLHHEIWGDNVIHFVPGIGITVAIAIIYFVTLTYGLVQALFTVIVALIIPGIVGWMTLTYFEGIFTEIAVFFAILAWRGAAAFFEVIFSALSGVMLRAVVPQLPLASIIGSIFGFLILVRIAILDWQQLFPSRTPEKILIIKFWAIGIVAVGTLAGSYISYLIFTKNDDKFTFIRQIAVDFAAIKGTSFRNANLTDADFTKATLKNTDFRKATLTRTCFHDTEKLDLIRPENTYLENTLVRQLLVSGKGQDKNFDRIDLRGVNLSGANLLDASFIGTDLSEACLQDADLSRAKLVQTQLDNTDFTGATLTGAFIEDWNITHDTNFHGVKCEYVYMRLPTKENPNPLRKPDNNTEVFADGEFGDFIQPIFDTLDLYHNQGVHSRAIAISFKELAEKYPDAELKIVALEARGEDKFLLRVKTAPGVDKSELSAEYFETYNHLKTLSSSQQIQYLLTELKVKETQINYQQNQIISYENMINTALGRPTIKAENYNNYGDTMPESNFDLNGAQFGGSLVNADTVNAEQIDGNINNNDVQKQNQKEIDNIY